MPKYQVRVLSRRSSGRVPLFLFWAGFLAGSFIVSGRLRAQALLSFISERDGNREVYLIGADGRAERRLTKDPADDYNGPATPDGKRLLVTRGEGPEGQRQFRFFLYPLPGPADNSSARPALLPLGKARWALRNPSFTADGRFLLFESESAGLRDLYRIGVDGSDLRQLTDNREGNFYPALSPRDEFIAFTSSRDRVSELYRMRLGGSDVRRLTYSAGSEWQPRFSPDGRWIFFVSDRDGADRLYRVDRNGSQPRRVTRRDLDSAVSEDQPSISADGQCLAFILRTTGQPARLRIFQLQTGQESELPTPPTHAAAEPVWAPPARASARPCSALAFTLRSGNQSQIYLADPQRRTVTEVTRGPGPNWHPLWVH